MMMFTDTSRGAAVAKDPAVVELSGQYFLYYTVKSKKDGLGIGIAKGHDLDSREKIGDLPPLSPCDENGAAAPGAIVIDGVVHLFYQSCGDGCRKESLILLCSQTEHRENGTAASLDTLSCLRIEKEYITCSSREALTT